MVFFCGFDFFLIQFVMQLLRKGILLFPRSPSDFWVGCFWILFFFFLISASSEALGLMSIFHTQQAYEQIWSIS